MLRTAGLACLIAVFAAVEPPQLQADPPACATILTNGEDTMHRVSENSTGETACYVLRESEEDPQLPCEGECVKWYHKFTCGSEPEPVGVWTTNSDCSPITP